MSVLAQGYICAEGGGNAGKGAWADEVFGWMMEKGGHGKVVIIGAVKLDEDERVGLFTRLGAKSVESLVVTEENADTQQTYDAIAAASVVFIRGGAQDRYVRWWKGKKTQRAIVEVWKKGGVVAGTSAGCAVLGEVVYDSLHGSLTAREALADGRHEHLSLTTDFLNLVPGVLFDTHFTERGRLARLPVMLAMCKEDMKKGNILGIGVDPRTAVCVGPDGIAEIRGEGTATFLRLTSQTQIRLEKGQPPTCTDLAYAQICTGYRYDLARREVVGRADGITPVAVHRPDPPLVVAMFFGDQHWSGDEPWRDASNRLWIKDPNPDGWLTGGPHVERGKSEQPVIVVSHGLADRAAPNSMTGIQRALASGECVLGFLLDDGVMVATAQGVGEVGGGPNAPCAALILDSYRMTHAGAGPGPRRAPVIEGALLHLIGPGSRYNFHTLRPTSPQPAPH